VKRVKKEEREMADVVVGGAGGEEEEEREVSSNKTSSKKDEEANSTAAGTGEENTSSNESKIQQILEEALSKANAHGSSAANKTTTAPNADEGRSFESLLKNRPYEDITNLLDLAANG